MVGVVRALIHSSVLPFAVSALLTSIAVGSYGWYVVNAARYQVAYGAFYSKGCSGSYCQTDYMQCLGAWYCLALGVFRVFAITASASSILGLLVIYYYVAFLHKKSTSKNSRLLRVAGFLSILITSFSQFSAFISFAVFRNQAGLDFFNEFGKEEGQLGFSFGFLIVAWIISFFVSGPCYYFGIIKGVDVDSRARVFVSNTRNAVVASGGREGFVGGGVWGRGRLRQLNEAIAMGEADADGLLSDRDRHVGLPKVQRVLVSSAF